MFCFFRSTDGNSAKLYSAPGYLPPEPQRPQTIPCANGRACVPKYQCQGGYIDASQVGGQRNQVILNEHSTSSILCVDDILNAFF